MFPAMPRFEKFSRIPPRPPPRLRASQQRALVTTSPSITTPSALLGLPLEIHRSVFKLLLFHELVKLRSTCRQLRDLAADDILRDALVLLESDWIEAKFRADSFNNAQEIQGPTTYAEPVVYAHQFLRAWGYPCSLRKRLPCYTCLRIRKSEDHFDKKDLNRIAPDAAEIAVSCQHPPTVLPVRKCRDCFMYSSDYLGQNGRRWLPPTDGNPESSWMAICKSCDKLVCSKDTVPRRQRFEDSCTDCYEGSHKDWVRIKNELFQSRFKLNKGRIERVESVHDYHAWMTGVDQGMSVKDNRPVEPEGFNIPNWEELRADALEKLPSLIDAEAMAPRHGDRSPGNWTTCNFYA